MHLRVLDSFRSHLSGVAVINERGTFAICTQRFLRQGALWEPPRTDIDSGLFPGSPPPFIFIFYFYFLPWSRKGKRLAIRDT